jgi:hypothetical protein
MAERNIVGGMFGITPEMYQQNLIARDTATNAQLAGLTPGQLAGFYAMEAGTGLGRAAGSLLGVEDPELAKIRDVQAMRTQFDVSNPAGLRQFAQALGQKGYTDLALQATARAADIDKDIATAEKARQEKLPAIANLQLYRDRLVQALGPNDPRVKEVNAAIEAAGKGQGTTINIDQKGETEFVKQLAKNDADTVKDAIKTRADAINSLNNLNTLATLNENELISGTYASGRVGAANFLQTIGLASESDKKRLATSEQFQKVGRDLILQTLGGKLGAGFSNEDRKFIESLIPSLENSPAARKQLIQFMQTKFTNVVDEVGRLENYAREKNGLKGYTYKTPLPSSSVAPSGAGKPTKADIEAEAAKRGIKL